MEEKDINTKPSLNGLFTLVIMVMVYLMVPQVIGSICYKVLKLNETISLMIGNAFAAIVLFLAFFKKLKAQLIEYVHNKEYRGKSIKYWLIGFALMYVANAILVFLVFKGKIATNEELNRQILKSFPLVAFFEISIIAPFLEEMIFRYGLRKFIGKNKYFPIITALIFGGLHALTGISSWMDLLYTIPYGALGYMFGLAYNETDNIFTSVASHAIHNTLSFILILLFT